MSLDNHLIAVCGYWKGKYFHAAMVTRGGVVTHAAPILKHSVGKPIDDVARTMGERGWHLNSMPDPLLKQEELKL